MQLHHFPRRVMHIPGILLDLHQQNFTWKDQLTSHHVLRPLLHNTIFIRQCSTHDFTEIVRFTLSVPLQDDSRGFLLLMGSGWQLCVCYGHNTHTSPPYCHQHITEVTQAVSSQQRPSPWCHPQRNEKKLIEKKKQEVIVTCCSAEGKRLGDFVIIFGNNSF